MAYLRPSLFFLTTTLCLAPAAASAQMDQAPTFSDATEGMWGFGTFEATFLLNVALIGAADACDDDEACLLAALVASAFTGVSAGAIAGATETPPDVPFFVHQTGWAAAGGFALGLGLWELADGDRDEQGVMGLTMALLSGVGVGAYTIARRDVLFRDAQTSGAAHFMAWGPMTVGLLAAMLAAGLDADDEVAAILTGAAGLLTWGVAAAMVEASAAR